MCEKKKDWQLDFVVQKNTEYAQIILEKSLEFSSIETQKMLERRLVIHEAILNALKYGGQPIFLKAWGQGTSLFIKLSQQTEIKWPLDTLPYKGVALIKRFSYEISISADKKTLFLSFL